MSAPLLATGGYDHTIRIWNPDSASCKRTLQFAESQINDLEISPSGSHIVAAGHEHVRLYDVNSTSPNSLSSFDGHVGNVTCVGVSNDSSFIYTGGDDETVKIYDLRSTDHTLTFSHTAPVTSVALHPNQLELISGDESGKIVRWDLRANQCTEHLIPALDVAVRSVAVSNDGQFVAAVNNEGNCYIWKIDGTDLLALKKITVHKSAYVLQCAFSPDSKNLATTSSDHTSKIWDVENDFTLKSEQSGHTMWVWDCAFSTDSTLLVTASSDCTARVWDVASGDSMLELKGHQRAVTSIALRD
eukprot:m.12906 g.12906  ORF g.12906 m.12906 type:complete len:301 (+) comp9501_c0_seq1:125-1027(+)